MLEYMCAAQDEGSVRPTGGDSVDAVLVASRVLVGVAARSLAAIEDTITLVQYRTLVLLASRAR